MKKILAFITKGDKFLLLKGSDKDPQFHESFWYTVTGAREIIDVTFEETVEREIEEETGLQVKNIIPLNWIFKYTYLGEICIEYAYIAEYEYGEVALNEENIEYRWCTKEEVLEKNKMVWK